ncbi:uncharacterized protein LOC120837565 [Ixodes scapularis]|uniref:uncharacterized protein LOC120837565 n=1 Tax=Ixodes scapularis TaxID=6945 RepID=UPI001C38526C|nr:uncharacterized protein LOC120837565 [Ixodes scapularis]
MGSDIADLKREVRREVRELKASLEYMNKDVETFRKECADLKKENATLKALNEQMAHELGQLKILANENAMRITTLDQYSRKKKIEIKGIPHDSNEDLVEVLGKVGGALEEPITGDDVEICHRVPVRNSTASQSSNSGQSAEGDRRQNSGVNAGTTSNIVVVFKSRDKRDAVLGKARKIRVTTDEIGFSVRQPIFLNEQLCPKLKKLLGMTIAKKREMNWRFAWTKNGKVFVRKTETSRAIQITCETDLAKMSDTAAGPNEA